MTDYPELEKNCCRQYLQESFWLWFLSCDWGRTVSQGWSPQKYLLTWSRITGRTIASRFPTICLKSSPLPLLTATKGSDVHWQQFCGGPRSRETDSKKMETMASWKLDVLTVQAAHVIGDLLKLSVSFTHAVRGGQEEEEDHYVEGIQKGAKQTKNFHYENFYNQIHDFFVCLSIKLFSL